MSFVNALQAYIDHPEKHEEFVVYNDNEVVIIRDMYPKALRHYLIIPKSLDITHVHPLEVFQGDPVLYDSMSNYINICKDLITNDLISKGYLPDTKLSTEEFKNTFILVGVHSIPSLRNLHIHVITKDFYSSKLKNKKHYNSFNTPFFVSFDKIEDVINSQLDNDSDLETDNEPSCNFLERDKLKLTNIIKNTPLICSYCKKSFGNKFQSLKIHLEQEFYNKFSNSASDA